MPRPSQRPHQHRTPTPLATLLVAWAVSLVVGLPAALAQQPQRSAPSSVVMGERPMVLAEVGLEADIPRDASWFRADRGDTPTVEVSSTYGSWFLIVQAPERVAPELVGGGRGGGGVDALVDAVLERLLRSYGVRGADGESYESSARVLLRERGLTVGGRPASRFFVSIPAQTEADRERVRMYTLVDVGQGRVVSFDLHCERDAEREARVAYLAILGSVRFSANAALAADRAVAIETGQALLSSLTAGDYAQAIARLDGRWDRLAMPAPTDLESDEVELGYRRIRAWEGSRGEVDPERSPEDWNERDHQRGLLVRLDGRLLDRGRGGAADTIIDTRVVCFMTPDRAQEAWTITTAVRRGERPPVVSREFGERDGEDMVVARRGVRSMTMRPVVPPKGYLNQLELYLLPQLLAAHGAPAEYAFYTYAGGEQGVRLRRFTLDRERGAAAWRLTTTLGDDPSTVSVLEADGTLIASDRPDGSRWTPTTRERLLDLWRRKGLPTSTPDR